LKKAALYNNSTTVTRKSIQVEKHQTEYIS